MMLSKNIKTALIVLLATAFSSAYAYDFKAGDVYYDILSETGGTCEVSHGTERYEGNIVIPSVVAYNGKQYTVTGIGDFAFSWCTDLTGVSIPQGVKSIGSSAFSWCFSLSDITLPESLSSIGDHAFSGCSGISTLTIPEAVTTIDNYAFYGCSQLDSISLPASLSAINEYAFSGCRGIKSIVIHEDVDFIGTNAFNGCSSISEVTCLATLPPTISSENALGAVEQRKASTLYVNYGTKDLYAEAYGWKDFGAIIEINVPDVISSPVADFKSSTRKVLSSGSIIIIKGNKQHDVSGRAIQ